MKLAFICNEYPPARHGGIGTFCRTLGRELARAGHDVRVLGVATPTASAPSYEEDHDVKVWRIPINPGRRGAALGRYRLYQQIRRWAHDGLIDIVEVPDWEGCAAGWPSLPIPLVTRLHGSCTYFQAEMGKVPGRLQFVLERASVRRSDYWCSVSKYTAEKTRSLFDLATEPSAVLYNPVDVPSPLPERPRDNNLVVFTGTLTEKKGVVPLIEGWKLLHKRLPDTKLEVFGKDGRSPDGGSMMEYLLSRLNPSDSDSVRFRGHVPRSEITARLQIAGAAIFPSYAEAFAIAPLESMACGCPTVYTQRGSGPELIDHKETGLLVDPDSPGSICAALEQILTDQDLSRKLSLLGARLVRSQYSVETVVRRNESFYYSCLEDFGSRH